MLLYATKKAYVQAGAISVGSTYGATTEAPGGSGESSKERRKRRGEKMYELFCNEHLVTDCCLPAGLDKASSRASATHRDLMIHRTDGGNANGARFARAGGRR